MVSKHVDDLLFLDADLYSASGSESESESPEPIDIDKFSPFTMKILENYLRGIKAGVKDEQMMKKTIPELLTLIGDLIRSGIKKTYTSKDNEIKKKYTSKDIEERFFVIITEIVYRVWGRDKNKNEYRKIYETIYSRLGPKFDKLIEELYTLINSDPTDREGPFPEHIYIIFKDYLDLLKVRENLLNTETQVQDEFTKLHKLQTKRFLTLLGVLIDNGIDHKYTPSNIKDKILGMVRIIMMEGSAYDRKTGIYIPTNASPVVNRIANSVSNRIDILLKKKDTDVIMIGTQVKALRNKLRQLALKN